VTEEDHPQITQIAQISFSKSGVSPSLESQSAKSADSTLKFSIGEHK